MKNSRNKLIIIVFIVILVIFSVYVYIQKSKTISTSTVYQTSTHKCPYFQNYRKIKEKTTYYNNTVGFSIEVPKGWYIPSSNDSDPRIYNCDSVDGGPSLGIYLSYINKYDSTNSDVFTNYKKELLSTKEKVYTNLIPQAVIIKEDMKNLETAPWGNLYTIIFEKEKKIFNLIVSGNIEESLILPSFKLI